MEFYRQQRNYALLESQQTLLDDTVVEAIERALPVADKSRPMFEMGQEEWWRSPIFVYLADSISHGPEETAYAVVAARGRFPMTKNRPSVNGKSTWRSILVRCR